MPRARFLRLLSVPPRPPPGASASGRRSARPGWRRDWFTPALIGLAALGGALVLARQAAYGVSVSFDSINYLAVAEHLLEGRGFRNYDWSAYAQQPPLYPLLLVAASLGVFEPIRVAGLLNAALFAAAIFVVGSYLRRRVGSGWLACWGAGAVALSLPLGDLGSWALSETAFILFTTLALVRTDDFLVEGRRASLVGAAVFCALAWQTRYIGVVVLAVVVAALWLGSDAALRERVRRSGLVAAAAAVPMALWTVRNRFAVGGFTGDREFRGTSWTARLGEVVDGLAEWVVFEFPGGAVLAAMALALVVFAVAVARRASGSTGDRDPRSAPAGLRSPAIFLGFASVFLFAVVTAAFFNLIEYGVEGRYLAPLYVPLVIVVVLAADRVFRFVAERSPGGRSGRGTGPRFTRSALAAGLFFVLSTQVAPTLGAVRDANSALPRSWRGFTAPPWHDSATFQYLDDLNVPGEVFSNIPILLYLRYGMRAFFRYLPVPGKWADWLEETEPGAYVVWFLHTPPNVHYPYRLGNLIGRAGLELVARFPDGVVFRVDRDHIPPNPYRAAAESIASDAARFPAARGDFDLFLDGTTLVYYREPCAPADTESPFFLHAYGGDSNFRSPSSDRYGFENLDFSFDEYGERFDGKCVAVVELSDAGLSRIRTGQYDSGAGELWSTEFSFAAEYRKQRLADSETLRYFQGRAGSGRSASDFPEPRAGEGWPEYRARALGAGTLLLRLRVGGDGPFSGAGFEPVVRFVEGAVFRVAPASASDPYVPAADTVASGAAGEAVARGEFDLFLAGTTLLYFREPCEREDTEPRFFLHAYPADPALLTPSREPYGFENLDFSFPSCGAYSDGRCVAVVALPEVPLRRVRTGQYLPGGPPLWEAEFSLSGDDAAGRGADAETMRRLLSRAVSGESCSPAPTAPGPARRVGGEESGGPSEPAPDEQEWNDWIAGAGPGALVVWFREEAPGSSVNFGIVETLAGRAGLEPLAWLGDGAVFRVNPDYAPDRERATYDYLVSGAAGGALEAEFDLYLDGTTLFYLRESCRPEDTNERFFLHVYASDPADLPDSRVRYGFENRDFRFSDAGRLVDGKCLASVRLPDFRIARVRTGRYHGNKESWSAEFRPGMRTPRTFASGR